jgi:hypothetical protein
MAIREFLCNAIDEGGHEVKVFDDEVDFFKSEPGQTTIMVEMTPEVQAVWDQKHTFFRLDPNEGVRVPGGRILPKVSKGVRLYRRGILVWWSDDESLNDYDVNDIDISEERIAVGYNVNSRIWSLVNQFPVEEKRKLLHSMKEFEQKMVCDWFTPSPSWREVIGDRIVCTEAQVSLHGSQLLKHDTFVLPPGWAGALAKCPGVKSAKDVIHVSPTKAKVVAANGDATVAKAVKIANDYGLGVDPRAVLAADEFDDMETDGCSKDGIIYVLKGLTLAKTTAVIIRERARITDDYEWSITHALETILLKHRREVRK